MSDRLRAAAEAALEAWDTRAGISQASEAFEELRAALAEQEDTRVCTCHPDDNPPQPCPRQYALDECRKATLAERQPTAKPECCAGGPVTEFCCGYPKLAEPQQEPVAEVLSSRAGNDTSVIDKALPSGTKLYTSPPRREWVSLTDEEREQFVQWMHPDVLERVEAALRAKNGGGE